MIFRRFSLLTVGLFLSTAALQAQQSGKELYGLYCAACHGTDGVGAEGNPNPPLAKSEWLQGTPKRAAAAVLKGLVGPIEVRGKMYNLAMPPQGAVLNDQQLASILTYVRKSWGNRQKKAITSDEIAAVRAELADRKAPWTAQELTKKYPIPRNRKYVRLNHLIATVYHGEWETFPDFSQLEIVSTEEEKRNLIDLAHADRTQGVGIVWTGKIHTDVESDFNAVLDASDGARMFINGEEIVTVEGVGKMGPERARRRRFRMSKGEHDFRLEYFNRNSETPGIVLEFKGKRGQVYLSESRLKVKDTNPPILLKPKGDNAVIYRNFIKGARPRSIGVGYAKGVNQSFSIEKLSPELVWTGKFIDAGRHWTNRGQGFEPPAGDKVVTLLKGPGYALSDPDKQLDLQYGGYTLDEKMQPHFFYTVEGVKVTDFLHPSDSGLTRTLTYHLPEGVEAPKGLRLITASADNLSVSGSQVTLDHGLTIQSPSPLSPDGSIPLTPSAEPTTLTLNYSWSAK